MNLEEKMSVGSWWSRDEDIAFERALAIHIDETENPWEKIATAVPGKTVEEIIEHYNILTRDVMMIESGCIPLPDYDFSEESNHNASDKAITILECGNNSKCEFKQKGESKLKQKRRKGIAWTSTEHRQFLLGLEQYGKSDWRSISRNCVVTRTSTQVASHAQKYFARLNSKNKNKNRTSIHDITVAENKYISTKQRAITWQNRNINLVAVSNNQAIQTTSPPLLDRPIHTHATQALSQSSLHNPTYGAPTIWNTQAALQPSANIPVYGTSTISQPMVGPMLSPFGTNMNRLAQPHMPFGVQNYSVACYSGPSAPINMDSIPNINDLFNQNFQS